MANVFAILSALALAAAAFFAVKNKESYNNQIQSRQTAEKNLARSQDRLETTTNKFNATEADRKSTQEEVVELKGKETAQQKKLQTMQSDVEDKTATSEANAKKIADIQEKLKETGEIEEIAGVLKRTSEEIEALSQEIASNKAMFADLSSERVGTEQTIAGYRDRSQSFADRRSYFSSTSIGAIFPAYGFVTLPVGASGGVVPGSDLNVVRDGAVVAKLRVRSVELGRAAAEIVPDSLAADTTLMVGDRVEPSKDAPKPEKKPAAAVAAPTASGGAAEEEKTEEPAEGADPFSEGSGEGAATGDDPFSEDAGEDAAE